MPGRSGVTVVTMLVCLFYFAYEAAGASSARHSLRPLFSERRNDFANLGRIAPRDRGDLFLEIGATSLRGAKATKQSILTSRQHGLLRGACHRARIRATRWLAMTVSRCTTLTLARKGEAWTRQDQAGRWAIMISRPHSERR